jgi:hypothetical protein
VKAPPDSASIQNERGAAASYAAGAERSRTRAVRTMLVFTFMRTSWDKGIKSPV